MKQGTGIFVLIALMVALRSWRSAPSETPPTQIELQKDESSKTTAPSDKGPGRLLLDAYGASPSSTLSILVATLPDPLASRLDWMFDSHLDALRRAFERAGYVLDRFSLPWESQAETAERKLPGRPGAILFRRAKNDGGSIWPDLWLVYVIGEVSTGGIDRAALRLALGERHALLTPPYYALLPSSGSKQDLCLIGPVFSGSAASLGRALKAEFSDKDAPLENTNVRVISGSATSVDPKQDLNLAGVTFETTLHTDDTLQRALIDHVLPRLGLQNSFAILQESTTAYGQSSISDNGRFLTIPFPMSISSLRRAVVHKTTTEDGAVVKQPGTATGAGVDLDLGDEPRPDAPSHASKLSAPSVDLLLEEVTRMLAQREIRAVLIIATDVRDKLFLGRELKKRLPDLQLLTTEGNVLYLRPDFNPWLRGMLVLSTYPLLLRDAAWQPQTNGRRGEQLMFANEGAEGTFNATLLALYGRDLSVPVADYAHPIKPCCGEARPPVWVTVVGAGTMLPMALYEVNPSSAMPVGIRTEAVEPTVKVEAHSFLYELVISVLSLSVLTSALVPLWKRDQLDPVDRELANLAGRTVRKGGEDHQRVVLAFQWEAYTIFWYLAFAGLLAPSVVLFWRLDEVLFHRDPLTLPRWLGSAAIAAALLAVVFRHVRRCRLVLRHVPEIRLLELVEPITKACHGAWWGIELGLRLGTVLMGALYAGLVLWWAVSLARMPPLRFSLFVHRSLELDQGVSPFVPMLFLGGLVVAWCQWHRSRVRGLTTSEPVETLSHGPIVGNRASEVRECLTRVLPTKKGPLLFLALGLAIWWAWVRYAPVLEHLAQGGAWIFECLLQLGVLAAMSTSLWGAYRLFSVWRVFEGALPGVESIPPLGSDDAKLYFKPNLGLWPSSRSHDAHGAAMRRWRSLLSSEQTPGLDEGERNELRIALEARDEGNSGWSEPLRRALARTWSTISAAPRPPGEPEKASTAGELVVMELHLYVEWVIQQMRTLSWFLLVSILLTTLAISSYPAQPQHLIQTISLLVFLVAMMVLAFVIGSMNRNAVLSRLAGTNPNELTWDKTLFANLGLYLVVPLVTLASSQNTALREQLFQWLDPVLRFLVTS